jgi:hypothetical protein
MNSGIAIPGLPMPLAWAPEPVTWSAGPASLEIEAGRDTDLFVDPGTGDGVDNAPRLLGPCAGDFQLSARVSVDFRASFDAAVLVVWSAADRWAKLCFEASPQLEPMVVSVVTRGVSDDCNSFVVEGDHVWLRVARIGATYAFHASTEGTRWQLVRHFGLGESAPAQVGFLAQSPRGAGCAVRFDEIRFIATRLDDIRSGD